MAASWRIKQARHALNIFDIQITRDCAEELKGKVNKFKGHLIYEWENLKVKDGEGDSDDVTEWEYNTCTRYLKVKKWDSQ